MNELRDVIEDAEMRIQRARERLSAVTMKEAGGGSSVSHPKSAAQQAHHDDYNLPLVVRWLCQRCHHEWHKANVAIPLRERAA